MKQTKYEQRKIAFLTGTTNAVDKQTKNNTGFLSHLRARKKSELLSAILIVKRIFKKILQEHQKPISIRNRIAEVSSFFPFILRTLPPPRAFLANFLWFEHKTLDLNDVEEQFAHQVGGSRVSLL